MAKPKKKKVLRRSSAEWKALDTQDVIRAAFGPEGHDTLRDAATAEQRKPKKEKEVS